jgi:hypothetical protein
MKKTVILFLMLFWIGTQTSSIASPTVRLRHFTSIIETTGNKAPTGDINAEKRMQVFEALAQDLPWSAEGLRQSGIIFQHTNTEHEPDDGEEYRSQEMHLFTFFLLKEFARLNNKQPSALLGPYRYCRVMGLPIELDVSWIEDRDSKEQSIAPNTITDIERMQRGFPFALLASYQSTNQDPLPDSLRTTNRDEEINQLYTADQQTRSQFKKEEMIFNRTIERIGDSQRRARLYEMIADDILWDANTLLNAAKVLNQTKSTIKQGGKTRYQLQENHLFAFFLARQAYIKGAHDGAALVVDSLNKFLRVSKMPENFGLRLIQDDFPRACQREDKVNIEQWGKHEFPFHLGKVMKPLCPSK